MNEQNNKSEPESEAHFEERKEAAGDTEAVCMDTSSEPDSTQVKETKSFVEKIAFGAFEYIETVSVTLVAVVIAFVFLFTQCRVDGPSMENTLYDGDRLIISDLFYTPQYGDIIVFHQTTSKVERFNEPIIKRVIAKGGDEVNIDFSTWTLYVNGEIVEEDYRTLKGLHTLTSDFSFPLTVPEGYVFVMGDNRNNSSDSRSKDIGFVDERSILGRVIFRLSPLDSFGTVE